MPKDNFPDPLVGVEDEDDTEIGMKALGRVFLAVFVAMLLGLAGALLSCWIGGSCGRW